MISFPEAKVIILKERVPFFFTAIIVTQSTRIELQMVMKEKKFLSIMVPHKNVIALKIYLYIHLICIIRKTIIAKEHNFSI